MAPNIGAQSRITRAISEECRPAGRDDGPWRTGDGASQTGPVIATLRRLAPLALLYAAMRYCRDWGATKGECRQRFPGDALVADPAVQFTEAVWVDAAPPAVWPWLAQIGLDRGGLYLNESFGHALGLNFHNARRIHPKWQRSVVGDAIPVAPAGWLGRRDGISVVVAGIVAERSLVLRTTQPGLPQVVWSFLLVPHGDDRSRLLVRMRVALRHPGVVVAMELLRPAATLATRSVLHGIKRSAERPHLLPVGAAPA